MVVKQLLSANGGLHVFESRVVLDGSQTLHRPLAGCRWFESRVVLDGSQTTVAASSS